ncbi:hypothetical protein Tcan_00437, partial [Toxocara canis]
MVSQTFAICVSALLFTTVLSLPLYSYEDLNNPTFILYRDGFLPVSDSEYGGIPYDARSKRSIYGLYK